MCPMQIRMAEVIMNELPKFLAEEADENTHAIIVDDPLNPNEPLVIRLALKVFTSYFPSRNPRASEYEDESIPHIGITSELAPWVATTAALGPCPRPWARLCHGPHNTLLLAL